MSFRWTLLGSAARPARHRYCDGSGTGISGIELAYDDWLSADQGEISGAL